MKIVYLNTGGVLRYTISAVKNKKSGIEVDINGSFFILKSVPLSLLYSPTLSYLY